MADGWLTLTNILAKKLQVQTLMIRASYPPVSGYVCDFRYWSGGDELRAVMAINDEPWKFYEEGIPLPVEDIARYSERRISDRVTPLYLAAIAERLGWPVLDPDFWRGAGDALLLHASPVMVAKPQSEA